ncbi:addiction module protein [Candidatus Thiosymbion oneisti]|uniref:addiction module protein n=2 Tax=Candidatus Thiosymbion oneisti TaxID=589554 RepID=UPI0010610EA4
MNTSEIKKMSTIECLQTMEAIWDTLLYDEIEVESPEWHRDVLEERMGHCCVPERSWSCW